MNEFDLIEHFFAQHAQKDKSVVMGIGDDCAVLHYNETHDLIITTDTMVEGVHFLPRQSPESLGIRAVAVNASDIAAMGGTAQWILLSLTLPKLQQAWLDSFSTHLHDYTKHHHITLIGGNTTRGPTSIGITALGLVPKGQAILRSGAQIDDDLWVTGVVGLARCGLALRTQPTPSRSKSLFAKAAINAYETPKPPLAFAPQLIGVANAMIDISDGLWQDTEHLAKASKVVIHLNLDDLPKPPAPLPKKITTSDWIQAQLTGGDDYQLLFTAPKKYRDTLQSLAQKHETILQRIGEVTAANPEGKTILCSEHAQWAQTVLQKKHKGFQHF